VVPREDSEPARGDGPAAALLIIDMISRWDFPDAPALLPRALTVAERLASLKMRWRAAGAPVIYANDNQGRWRSERAALFDAALAAGGDGARIARLLAPDDEDYFVLKPKHSAFFATPLLLLLQHLKVHRVVLAGVTADQCILATAMDARVREVQALVVRDAIASPSDERTRAVLRHFEQVLQMATPPAAELPQGLARQQA
jgi:nicotinamidase-related amidase